LENNFTSWTSGNEIIDNLIQEMQLGISGSYEKVFEWVPYNQFGNIKEIGRGDFAKIYSVIWKNGPLFYDNYGWTRESNLKVNLRCLYNSQNITNESILNEV